MMREPLSEEEAAAFGARLDAFGKSLSPGEESFLKAILADAETAQTDGIHAHDAGPRAVGEMVIAIHLASLSPPISLNPQPIPRRLPRYSDVHHGEG